MDKTCSHVWKDRRYMQQFVFNWLVSPWIDPALPLDGKPLKHMQYGQIYECQSCHEVLKPIRSIKPR